MTCTSTNTTAPLPHPRASRRARTTLCATLALALFTVAGSVAASTGTSGSSKFSANQAGAVSSGPYQSLVIRGAMIIPGHGGPAYGPADIVIEGATISRIVPLDPVTLERGGDADRPQGDRVIDATGMYVMPGMIDLHTHIRTDPLPLEYVYAMKLAHGVTTMANASDRGFEAAVAEAARSADNEVAAPRMFPLHSWSQFDPEDDDPTSWTDPGRVRRNARELVKAGAHVVSVGNIAWHPELFAAVSRAVYEVGGITTVHLPPSSTAVVQAVQAAEAGVTMIEHHYGYAESALDRKVQDFPANYNFNNEIERFRHAGKVWLEAPRDTLLEDVAQRLADSGVAMIPTMSVYEANRDINRAMSLPWHNKYTHRALIDWSFPNPSFHGSYHWDWTSDDEATWTQMYRLWQELIFQFNRRGGTVGYATDDNYIWAVGGISNVRELQLMQETGMHPLEIIKSATFNSAKILRQDDLGMVRPGFKADLAIVNGNPLHSFRSMYAFGALTLEGDNMVRRGGVRWTLKDGVVFDTQALMANVVSMVAESKRGWTNPVDALFELPQ